MRYWMYVEPVSATSSEPVYQVLSDKAVLDFYWEYWCSRMRAVGREAQISENNCILDWSAIHWAEPATPESLLRIISAPKGE
jgi:hypothetical protein